MSTIVYTRRYADEPRMSFSITSRPQCYAGHTRRNLLRSEILTDLQDENKASVDREEIRSSSLSLKLHVPDDNETTRVVPNRNKQFSVFDKSAYDKVSSFKYVPYAKVT